MLLKVLAVHSFFLSSKPVVMLFICYLMSRSVRREDSEVKVQALRGCQDPVPASYWTTGPRQGWEVDLPFPRACHPSSWWKGNPEGMQLPCTDTPGAWMRGGSPTSDLLNMPRHSQPGARTAACSEAPAGS